MVLQNIYISVNDVGTHGLCVRQLTDGKYMCVADAQTVCPYILGVCNTLLQSKGIQRVLQGHSTESLYEISRSPGMH